MITRAFAFQEKTGENFSPVFCFCSIVF